MDMEQSNQGSCMLGHQFPCLSAAWRLQDVQYRLPQVKEQKDWLGQIAPPYLGSFPHSNQMGRDTVGHAPNSKCLSVFNVESSEKSGEEAVQEA